MSIRRLIDETLGRPGFKPGRGPIHPGPGYTTEQVEAAVRKVLSTRAFAHLLVDTQRESRIDDIVTALTEDILAYLTGGGGCGLDESKEVSP